MLFRSAGGDDYLVKPIDFDRLDETFESLSAGHEKRPP